MGLIGLAGCGSDAGYAATAAGVEGIISKTIFPKPGMHMNHQQALRRQVQAAHGVWQKLTVGCVLKETPPFGATSTGVHLASLRSSRQHFQPIAARQALLICTCCPHLNQQELRMGPPAVRAGSLCYSYNFVAQDSGLTAALQGLPRLQVVQVVGLSSDQVTTLKVKQGMWQHWVAIMSADQEGSCSSGAIA